MTDERIGPEGVTLQVTELDLEMVRAKLHAFLSTLTREEQLALGILYAPPAGAPRGAVAGILHPPQDEGGKVDVQGYGGPSGYLMCWSVKGGKMCKFVEAPDPRPPLE